MTLTVNMLMLVGAILSTLTYATVLPPPAGWPIFTYQGVLTDNLTYNPNNEYVPPFTFRLQVSILYNPSNPPESIITFPKIHLSHRLPSRSLP